MSHWTYVSGLIRVSPVGRTQHEKRYVLETVLEHLPAVSSSEGYMDTYIIQKKGWNIGFSHNEFDECLSYRENRHKPDTMQSEYFVIVDGSLRDRFFEQTSMEFNKWLNRLAKRVSVEEILVKVSDLNKEYFYTNSLPYEDMYEYNPSWTDYLLWNYEEDRLNHE